MFTLNKQTTRYFFSKMGLFGNKNELKFRTRDLMLKSRETKETNTLLWTCGGGGLS